MISGLRWKPQAAALLGSVGLIWAVSLYGLFVHPGVVSALALVPRSIDGLPGVLGTLLVHGSLGHLAANTPPLLVLGGMVAVRGAAYYLTAALAITVVGGLGLWVVGRDAAHIGASGLIFGLFGFLVARGYYERRWSSIAAALVVVVLYGGMIAGVVPRGGQISWEAHLCGLLAGILCAWSLRRRTGDAGVSR
ncbi:MAG: rhomboid family intramembrane serine protease [Acidobacteria bacterium]|nr:rhomboid family intramembrane serine protease [Acidobacteriota bacterium]